MKSTQYKYNNTYLKTRSKNIYQILLDHQEQAFDKILTDSCLQSPSKILKDDSFLDLLSEIDPLLELSISSLNIPQSPFNISEQPIQLNQSLNNLINYEQYKLLQQLQNYLIIQTSLPIVKCKYLQQGLAFIIRLKEHDIIQLTLQKDVTLKFAMKICTTQIMCQSTNQTATLKPNMIHVIRKKVTIHNQGNISVPICFHLSKNQ